MDRRKLQTHTLIKFLKERSGATAIEYALIASLLSTAIIAGAQAAGSALTSRFTAVATGLKNAQ